MAYKCREEIVGKRFLSVRSPTKLKVSKISEWEWRSGVVRAVSSRDTASVDFTALVEYEDVEWHKREWTRVHETYQEFLVEHTLVWTCRPVADKESTPSPPLPALCFKPIVDKLGLGATKKRVVEFLVDHDLAFVEEEDIRFYQEGDENRYDAGSHEAQKAVKAWVDYQDGQKILLTTPTVLVGYRLKVYRAEGTTQWYTAVIQSYNHTTKSLTITDDTVLEEHNEDPALIQMRLIDNGVVDSILRGVEVGIAPRRRPRNNQVGKEQSHQATFGRRQPPQQCTANQSSKQVTAARPATKARQHVPRSSLSQQEVDSSQERGSSRGKCQASEKRKRKSEGTQAAEPAPRSASPNKRVKSGETDTEARTQSDSHGKVSVCLERDASSGEAHTSAGAKAGASAPRDKTSRSQRQKASAASSGGGGGGCKGSGTSGIQSARERLTDNSSEGGVVSSVTTTTAGSTCVLDSVQKAERTVTTVVSTTSLTPAFSPTVVLSSLPRATSIEFGRKDSKQTTSSRKKPTPSRKASDEESEKKKTSVAAGKHGVAGPESLLVSCRNPVTGEDAATAARQLVSHSHTPPAAESDERALVGDCSTTAGDQPEDSSMHLKKQQALLAGRNNSSPSSSIASQTAALPAGIDVTRSLTDQLTKLAKADKLALGGDSKSDTDSSTSTTEAAVTPVINTVSHSADRGDSSSSNNNKVQELFGERHREASAFTCVQTTASRNSIATTPLSDDRAESRGNEGQLVGEEQRPASRPEERRNVKSSPASSPLIVDRGEPVHPYRDPVLMSKNPVRSTLNTCVAPSLHKPLGGAVTYAVPTAVPVGLTTSSSSSSTLTSPHPTSLARSLVPGLSYAHQLAPGVISHGLPMPHGYSQLDALTARGLAAAAAAAQQQQMAALQQYQNSAHLLPTLPYTAALAGGGGGGGRLPQLEVLQKYPQGPVPSWLGDALIQREQLERKLEQERLEREHLERLELERQERERMERAERERRERKEKMERERLEREKVEKEKAERLEREKAERERLEKERQERERLLEQREWEQRQERERILREAADTSAAVDQHFTASLSRLANQRGMAQGMWPPAPSISKGTGKGLLGKTELPSVSQGDKVSDHLEEDRIKREEHERLVLGDDKRHIQGILEQRGDQKSEGVTGKDNKPIYGYPPYHYSSSGYPLFTNSSSGKPEAISFSLYGYQSQYSTMTTEQLQKKGLAPGSGRLVKEEKGIYPSPAHSSNPSPPRVSHMMPPHHRDIKPQSSVIVENKPVVKIENPVTAHSHHHSSSSLSSSSSSPRPRPAHMPEQRLDPPLSSAGSTNSSISHHIMASTTTTSMPPTSHTTAFCAMDAKSMSRAQSPYKMGSQLTPGPTQPPPPPQRQQAPGLLQNQQQPINYCKSSGKIKGQNVPTQSGGPLQAAIAQPPVSSSIAYSYSLIQQGLVPNPMYTQGTVSASVPLGRSQATAAATTTITTTTTSTPSSVASVHNPYLSTGPPSATQQTTKHPQHSPTSGGNKRKAVSGGRDNGTIQKRSKAATAESEAIKRRTPTTSMVSVPVTTPQILTNPSPYTTSSAVNLQPGNPPTATPDGFLDSFRSFVETTVHKAFLQDQELELEKEEHERLQKQELQQKQQQQGQGGFEKVDPPVVLSREDVSQSPLMSTTGPQTPVTMDMVNRVTNGLVDTDSDTLSAPSPPPSQTRMDASPHGRGGAAIATKVKKAWLQRHSGEDKKCIVLQASPSPLALAQEDSNSSQSTSREVKCFLKDAVTSVLDSSASSANGEGTASPAPSIILANGNISDLKHANDESTSSASETESQSPAMAKKRTKSRKSIPSKKGKTEDRGSLSPTHGESNNPTPNNVRKKNPSKRSKTDSKENPKPKEKQDTRETSSTLPSSQLSITKQSPVLAQSSASSSPITVKKTEGRPVKSLLPSKHACDDSPQPSSQDSEKDSDSNGKDRKKTRRSRDNFRESPSKNDEGSSFNKPLVKDSVATLKRTGAPFIQDGPCSEVTPKLSKCRECKMTPTQRSKKIPNIFCRFYAFRRLKYSAKGSVTIAGFSELSDADPDDIEPWLPRYPTEDPQLDDENAKFIIAKVGDKFCELVEQEKEAKSWAGDDAKIAWKRAVTGVREMCDVCDTTLFNMHWVCHKCGFVVCLDCYKSKMKANADGKNEDCCKWLTCSSNRQAHEAEKLMLTQIIPSDALWELGRLIHDIRRKWSIPAKCPCGQNTIDSKSANKNGMNQQLVKKMMNGIGDESGKKGKRNLALHHNEDKLVEQDEFNQDSLALLANVAALRGGDKPDKRSSKADKIADDDLLGEDGDKKSSGSCSTLRELLTKTAGKGKVPNEKKTRPKTSGSSLDNIIQSVVEKSCRDLDTGSQPFKFLHYIPRLGQWNRELPIIAHSLTETSVLYPDVPHSWLCDGRLLRLHDPRHKGNLKIFQEQWKRGQPVLVSCVNKLVKAELWHPESFSNEFGHLENDLVNCRNGNVIVGNPMKDFWDGFESIENRLLDEDGSPMLLKLKDWPPGDDFSDMLPSRFQDLMQALPLPEYTGRNGKLNLASRLPDFLVRPDLGPKMYNAYGSAKYPKEGTTNLHLDISDAVNVLVYVGVPSDGPRGRKEHEEAAVKAIDEAGCDNITKRRVREVHEIPGALWQIYDAHDADKIRDFLNKVAKERGETIEPDHDSIHDQSWYLDEELRERLLKEYGVQGYTIVQCLGDAIFIPAGAPHQVRNLHSCIKVAEDFVSPEHLNHCFRLTQEFRQLSDTHSNHEDKLQVKNIIYHAVKDAIAVLRELDPDDKK